MALVRCPTHKIPYNDENPRGCPACSREKQGAGRPSAIQELARVAQAARRPGATATVPPPAPPKPAARATRPSIQRPFAVTTPPKAPVPEEGTFDKLRSFAEQRSSMAAGAVAIAAIVLVWVLTSGPRFMEGLSPVPIDESDVRPLPLDPNGPVSVAFSALGNKPPIPNPESPRVARYTYGADLTVDVLNGLIYAITLRIPNRSWNGLYAGMDQRTAEGTLALLGPPQQSGSYDPQPSIVDGFMTFPTLDGRPRRTLRVEVRPPNGCFDVLVDIQPQAIGMLQDGENRQAVVGYQGDPFIWVVTQIRIVSRSMTGPYSTGPAC